MSAAEAGRDVLGAALEYAGRGKPVFPCGPDKQPLTPRGFKDATTDAESVRAWWTRWPQALIGMPTGAASGVIVLDLDKRDGFDGTDTLDALASDHESMPDTIEALTPSGGRHLYFVHPGGRWRNSASRVGLGIDVRADGGYVVVPPSRLPDGRAYEWEATNPRRPAEMPAWLLRRVGQRPKLEAVENRDEDGKVRAGAGRNNHLASFAGKLAWAGLDRAQLWATIQAENARVCSPPLSDDELRRTVMKSASRWSLEARAGGVQDEAEQATSGRLRFVEASVLAERLAPPEFLIDGLLEVNSLAVLFGAWGSGKSFLASIDWACRLAAGMPVHGRATKACDVVLVAGEGQGGLPRRLAAWAQHHGEPVPDNLLVLPHSLAFGDERSAREFKAALHDLADERGRAPGLVISDTMARNFGPGDENSNADMSRRIDLTHQAVIDPFGATFLDLHHPGHGNAERARGASALPGAADTQYRLDKAGDCWLTLTTLKTKDFEPPEPLGWQLVQVPLVVGGVEFSSATVEECDPVRAPDSAGRLSEKERLAVEVLRDAYTAARRRLEEQGRYPADARVDVTSWRTEIEAAGVVAGKNARTLANKLRYRLRDKGWIREASGFVFLSDEAEEEVF